MPGWNCATVSAGHPCDGKEPQGWVPADAAQLA
jgi:hypothetical protein